jgi:Tol biopolymer transport system component
MYFGASMAGRRHLWRQRFPDGQPEQITSGPAEEDGVAVAPDGRSLITSISMRQSSVWMHDSKGDHAVSTEGYAAARDETQKPPSFSADGKRLYYLLRRDSPASPTELWRADLDSGKSKVAVSGFSIRAYDISSDEKEVVFSTLPAGQASQLWLAPLDRHAPPRRIAATGEADPHFGPDGQVLFRLTDGEQHYLARMGRDGAGRTKVVPYPVINIMSVSPDRRTVILFTGLEPSNPTAIDVIAVPVAGGRRARSATVCAKLPGLPTDGTSTQKSPPAGCWRFRCPRAKPWPPLPASGIRWEADGLAIPGAKIIEQWDIAAGPDPSTYAYVKSAVHANLFRIGLR